MANSEKSTKRHRVWAFVRSSLSAVTVGINGIVMLATIFSAYGGYFDPAKLPVAPLAAMLLSVLLIAGVVLIIIDLMVNPRIAVMIITAWLISLPPLLVFFPLNFRSTTLTPGIQEKSFTFLTYNCMHLWLYKDDPDLNVNGAVDYILKTDADIVNLQEMESLEPNPGIKFTPEQRDSLLNRYPYHITDRHQQLTVLSKFPVEEVDTTIPRRSYPCLVGVFRLNVRSTPITLYNVHLKSIGLNRDDKDLFREIPRMIREDSPIREDIQEVKTQLISKLSESFVTRGTEARWLRQMIDSIGGNVIVAGDFNDIPGCHAGRIIMNGDLRDAYAENAFGPRITYHDNNFYFRIDHVLYGGNLEAVYIRRDTPPWSDHYPLLTRFVIK